MSPAFFPLGYEWLLSLLKRFECESEIRTEERRVSKWKRDQCADGYHHHEDARRGSSQHHGPLLDWITRALVGEKMSARDRKHKLTWPTVTLVLVLVVRASSF